MNGWIYKPINLTSLFRTFAVFMLCLSVCTLCCEVFTATPPLHPSTRPTQKKKKVGGKKGSPAFSASWMASFPFLTSLCVALTPLVPSHLPLPQIAASSHPHPPPTPLQTPPLSCPHQPHLHGSECRGLARP